MKNFIQEQISASIRTQPIFWGLYALYLVLGGVFLAFFTKEALHLQTNEWHTGFGDTIFYYLTYLGDGWAFVLLIVMLAVLSHKKAVVSLVSLLLTTLVVQLLKNFVFSETKRPSMYFKGFENLNFVEDVELHSYNSFPSGHSATAFSVFLILTFLTKNKWLGGLFFVAALSASFSRIYLQQHFFVDTYFGAFIGILLTTLSWVWLHRFSFFRNMK